MKSLRQKKARIDLTRKARFDGKIVGLTALHDRVTVTVAVTAVIITYSII